MRSIGMCLCLGLFLGWTGHVAVAQAQDACFQTGEENASSGQHLVGLDTSFRLNQGCEYALAAEGPWVRLSALQERDVDFLEAYQGLVGDAQIVSDPRAIHGRRVRRNRGRSAHETLLLRYCSHFLLEERLGFTLGSSGEQGSVRLERTSDNATCGASAVELRAYPDAGALRIREGEVGHRLSVGETEVVLESGDWSVYAARPDGRFALRVAVFRPQRVVTPLQHRLRSAAAGETSAPLFAFEAAAGGPGMLLEPTAALLSQRMLFAELRTAADAGWLWMAEDEGQALPRVVMPVQFESMDPPMMRLPDAFVRRAMQTRYGEAGQSVAASLSDWQHISHQLHLCLAPNYQQAQAVAIGSVVPDASACASLHELSVFAQVESALRSTQVCLTRGVQVMRSDAAVYEPGQAETECFTGDDATFRFAVVGDRMQVAGDDVCVLLDNRPLQPMAQSEAMEDSADRTFLLEQSGLVEVRRGGGSACASRQALGIMRFGVVDPERDWHPVGLFSGAQESSMECALDDGEDASTGVCPWRALAHDEQDVFAFSRHRDELHFAQSTSPALAASVTSDAASAVQVNQLIPLLGGIRGQFEGARPSAIVAFVQRDETCPMGEEASFASLQSRAVLDVDALPVDASFYVFLGAIEGDSVRCLARAQFRNRPSRALYAQTFEDVIGLEVGVLGDTRATFFFSTPMALGLTLPVAYFRVNAPLRFIAFEVAANLTMAGAFDPAALSRVGASLSVGIELGIPEVLPRLLSVGMMVHGAAETHPVENPIVSGYLGLNLSTLIDLAGGR